MIEETVKLCNGNSDIFEKFYFDNNELYGDISSTDDIEGIRRK